jgi:hypothetical protein
MHRASDRLRNLARAFIAATFVLAFGPAANGLAQDSQQPADTASSTATTADQPRRNRQRRRAEDEAPASDAQTQDAAAPATDAAAPGVEVIEVVEERLVCKSEKLAGTKIARRTCGTPEQWEARSRQTSRAAQDAVQEIRNRSAFPAPPTVPVAIP